MNHSEAHALLDAFLDDEPDPATALAIDAHLQSCDACRSWLAERRRLVQTLHAAPLRHAVPPEMVKRVRSQRAARPSPQASSWAWPRPWSGAVAAGLVLAVGGFLLGRGLPRAVDLGAQLVNARVSALMSDHTVEVLSSDHHTVKPWLSARLPFSPPVPELSGSGDALLGARVGYLDHTRVAALVYQHGRHQVEVFVWPSSARTAPLADTTIDGYQVLAATSGEFTAALVSDLEPTELAAFRTRWLNTAEHH